MHSNAWPDKVIPYPKQSLRKETKKKKENKCTMDIYI
jgi:hypothetical protein